MKVDYVDHMGSDLTVVNAARVSHEKHHTEFRGNDEGLINFLAERNHYTPFAHPHITLRVTAPIFVARQAFKHKVGFVENEISRRYVDSEPSFYEPTWRMRAENVKQGSGGEAGRTTGNTADNLYNDAVQKCLSVYRELLALGLAPEQARMVLPQSMYTSWYWTGSLYAYSRFFNLRSYADAQKEIQELAGMVGDTVKGLCPISWKALTCIQ